MNHIISLGYIKEQALYMTSFNPLIYSLDIENIKGKINMLLNNNYSKDEVINMTVAFPTIFCYSNDNLLDKIKLYDYINIHDVAIIDPKQLMQSASVSYARYCYYNDIGIDIDINNYKRLFLSESLFKRQYNISKKELLNKYDYNDFKKNIIDNKSK